MDSTVADFGNGLSLVESNVARSDLVQVPPLLKMVISDNQAYLMNTWTGGRLCQALCPLERGTRLSDVWCLSS